MARSALLRLVCDRANWRRPSGVSVTDPGGQAFRVSGLGLLAFLCAENSINMGCKPMKLNNNTPMMILIQQALSVSSTWMQVWSKLWIRTPHSEPKTVPTLLSAFSGSWRRTVCQRSGIPGILPLRPYVP